MAKNLDSGCRDPTTKLHFYSFPLERSCFGMSSVVDTRAVEGPVYCGGTLREQI